MSTNESSKPSVKIQIDPQRLASILGILTAIASGESSPTFIEERVKELQEYVPFLRTAVSWMGEALDRWDQAKDKDITNDLGALREFMIHTDMLNRAQGALAALLCVGEYLRSEALKPPPKRTRKGKRNVTKRGAGGIQGAAG